MGVWLKLSNKMGRVLVSFKSNTLFEGRFYRRNRFYWLDESKAGALKGLVKIYKSPKDKMMRRRGYKVK